MTDPAALVARLRDGIDALAAQLAQACRERDVELARHRVTTEAWCELHNTLRTIAAQETPGANGTVKRMARMAREALE